MSESYKPINCDFHELLLAKATLKKTCEIVYIKNKKEVIVNSKIKDVFTQNGEEFMTIDTGEKIRLDFIKSVDSNTLPEFSCTLKR